MAGNEREAAVKITLKTGSYIGALKDATRQTVDYGKQWGRALKGPTIAGLKEVSRSIRGTVDDVRKGARWALTLGGAFSFGGAIKGAEETREQFRNLGTQVAAGKGEVLDWGALMKDAQTAALQWGRDTRELGGVFKAVYDDIGDVGFAKAAMLSVAMTARATGESVENLSTIAGQLNEKFGVTAEQLPEAMAAAISLGNKGGVGIADLGSKIGILGASAKAAGLAGQEGLQKIVGMANVADASVGNFRKVLVGVTGLIDDMVKPEQQKKIAQVFRIATNDAKGNARDFTKILGDIFTKTGGKREQLAKVFEGEQLKLVTDLGKVFKETFEGTTGTVKQKTAAALAAYEAQLREAGRVQISAADLAKQAAENVKDPQVQVKVALERLAQAFTKPQMVAALERLAAQLPALADKMAGLVQFTLDNPKMAAGIVLGMKLGAPFLSGALQAGAPAVGKAILAGLTSKSMAGAFTPSGAVPGVAAKGAGALASAAAVVGAGFVGYEIGNVLAEKAVNPVVEESRGKAVSLEVATRTAEINTSGKFSREGAETTIANLKASLEAAKKDREFSWKDIATLGLRRLGTSSEGDVAKGEEQLAKSEAALREKLGPSADKTALALDRMAPAAEKTAGALDKVGDAADKMAMAADRIARSAVGVAPAPGAAPSSGPPPRGPMPVSPARPGYLPRG